MGEVIKILGQSAPSAASATTLYTVPASTRTVVSKLFACNQNSSSGAKVRVWVAVNGAVDNVKQYLYYDHPLDVPATLDISNGIALGPADLLRIQSDTANVSFSAFGAEATSITDTPKVLGQNSPSANTATTLYTVPASTVCVVSGIFACNTNVSAGPTSATSRSAVSIWFQINGASDDPKQYIFKDFGIGTSDTLVVTPGVTLAAGDVIRIQASATNIAFNAFGMEMAA